MSILKNTGQSMTSTLTMVVKEAQSQPKAELMIANLLIEYIGYERILQSSTELPNVKALERIDYRKRA